MAHRSGISKPQGILNHITLHGDSRQGWERSGLVEIISESLEADTYGNHGIMKSTQRLNSGIRGKDLITYPRNAGATYRAHQSTKETFEGSIRAVTMPHDSQQILKINTIS